MSKILFSLTLILVTSLHAQTQEETTMSNEEQEIIEANYERTKSEYNSSEEDPLFDKVSKAYVRNLDKVLTRKKRIED